MTEQDCQKFIRTTSQAELDSDLEVELADGERYRIALRLELVDDDKLRLVEKLIDHLSGYSQYPDEFPEIPFPRKPARRR